jgi:hypothetical protein
MLESLISETQAMRLVQGPNGYKYIKPPYKNLLITTDVKNYNSKLNPLSRSELVEYMTRLNLI